MVLKNINVINDHIKKLKIREKEILKKQLNEGVVKEKQNDSIDDQFVAL